jgi:hypothetical protein
VNPLKRLIDEIAKPQTTRGRVVRVADGKVVIKSQSGAVIASADSLKHYAVGEQVLLANGAIVGRVRDDASLPTFYV